MFIIQVIESKDGVKKNNKLPNNEKKTLNRKKKLARTNELNAFISITTTNLFEKKKLKV